MAALDKLKLSLFNPVPALDIGTTGTLMVFDENDEFKRLVRLPVDHPIAIRAKQANDRISEIQDTYQTLWRALEEAIDEINSANALTALDALLAHRRATDEEHTKAANDLDSCRKEADRLF